jgi:histidinol phosphatase-like enzyme (inositol monophosphatase family)
MQSQTFASDWAPEMLAFARRLAAAARAETFGRWQAGCPAEDKGGKADFDPVTEADRAAERAMRALIEAEYPDHGISGEEYPDRPANGPFTWSLDPVDGTRSFTCGLPTWVTLIALLHEGEPVVGVIDAPGVDEIYWAAAGQGRFRRAGQDAALGVSGCATLGDARLSTTDPYMLELDVFDRLRSRARTTRYGHDGYGYARLAAGTIDLVVECGLSPYDYNALIPVVRAAGGRIGDWAGGEDFSHGKIIAAGSDALFEEAVRVLAEG